MYFVDLRATSRGAYMYDTAQLLPYTQGGGLVGKLVVHPSRVQVDLLTPTNHSPLPHI